MEILILEEYTKSRVSKILLNKFVAHVLGLATDDFVERCGTVTHIDLCVDWRLQFMLFHAIGYTVSGKTMFEFTSWVHQSIPVTLHLRGLDFHLLDFNLSCCPYKKTRKTIVLSLYQHKELEYRKQVKHDFTQMWWDNPGLTFWHARFLDLTASLQERVGGMPPITQYNRETKKTAWTDLFAKCSP